MENINRYFAYYSAISCTCDRMSRNNGLGASVDKINCTAKMTTSRYR